MIIEKNMRVVTTIEMPKVSVGTVGTVNQIVNDTAILQYNYNDDEEKPEYVGIPINSLRLASLDDIIKIKDYRKLVNPAYFVGRKFRKEKSDNIYTITDIVLNPQMVNDNFALSDKDDKIIFVNYATLASALYIQYDEEIESMLGEEINDGKYVEFNVGLRVKLKNPRKFNIQQENAIATIVFIIDNSSMKIWFKDHGRECELTVDISDIHLASLEEIHQYENKEELVDSDFAINNVYKANEKIKSIVTLSHIFKVGDMVKIIDIKELSTLVVGDIFVVKNEAEEMITLSTYDLYSYFDITSNMILDKEEVKTVFHPEEPQFSHVESLKELDKMYENDIEIDDEVTIHSLTINDFRFDIDENGIIGNEVQINKDNLDAYIEALTKLKKFLK